MKYDSVLDQQSISGKIVSLILCVWKPCYVKSGHILYIYTHTHIYIYIAYKVATRILHQVYASHLGCLLVTQIGNGDK